MLFLLNIYIKQRFNGGHLGFHNGRYGYKVENMFSAIVDLKNVCLYTKIMFPLYVGAEMCE